MPPAPMIFKMYGEYSLLFFSRGSFDINSGEVVLVGEGDEKTELYMNISEYEYQYSSSEARFAYYVVPGPYGAQMAGGGGEDRSDFKEGIAEGEKAYAYKYGRYPMQATRPVIWKNGI